MLGLLFFLALIDNEEASAYFQDLYLKYHEKMFYVSVQLTKDDMMAEDAVQETFYRLAVKEDQLEWLMGFRNTEREAYSILFMCKQITLNMINKAFKKHEELSGFSEEEMRSYSSCENFLVEDTPPEDESDGALFGETEDSRRLAWSMHKLPPEDSSLLMMFYYYKFSLERIAQEMGLDKKSVYVRKSRALKRLKSIYLKTEDYDFDQWNTEYTDARKGK